MAKIVAIANQKGGVGKTTTAVNLSSCVAALGKRVLIVDLDPQGNTTTGYGIPKRSVEKGTYEILIGEARASEAIRKTEYRTDVIGSNTRLAGASLEMIDLPARESRLRKALAEVQKDYDFIFIDCPPSLDLLTLNGLSACDSVLIPVQCEYYENRDFVFAQDNGQPLHPDSVTDWMKKFSKRHGLPHINPHAFRHTMASMLYFSGVDSVSISKRLGHAQVSTTANIYAHIVEEADKRNADILASVFLKKA